MMLLAHIAWLGHCLAISHLFGQSVRITLTWITLMKERNLITLLEWIRLHIQMKNLTTLIKTKWLICGLNQMVPMKNISLKSFLVPAPITYIWIWLLIQMMETFTTRLPTSVPMKTKWTMFGLNQFWLDFGSTILSTFNTFVSVYCYQRKIQLSKKILSNVSNVLF